MCVPWYLTYIIIYYHMLQIYCTRIIYYFRSLINHLTGADLRSWIVDHSAIVDHHRPAFTRDRRPPHRSTLTQTTVLATPATQALRRSRGAVCSVGCTMPPPLKIFSLRGHQFLHSPVPSTVNPSSPAHCARALKVSRPSSVATGSPGSKKNFPPRCSASPIPRPDTPPTHPQPPRPATFRQLLGLSPLASTHAKTHALVAVRHKRTSGRRTQLKGAHGRRTRDTLATSTPTMMTGSTGLAEMEEESRAALAAAAARLHLDHIPNSSTPNARIRRAAHVACRHRQDH